MSRNEKDIEIALGAQAAVTVDTDAVLAGVARGVRRRRRRRAAGASVGSALAVGLVAIALPSLLGSRDPGTSATGTGGPVTGTGPIVTGASGWTLPRGPFTGNCTVGSLAEPGGVEPGLATMVADMDPSGRYVVGSYGPPISADGSWSNADNDRGKILAVRWDDGVPAVLAVPGDDVAAMAVNSHGSTAGSLKRNGTDVAWVMVEGTGADAWQELPLPDGYSSAYAIDINDNGEIVGEVQYPLEAAGFEMYGSRVVVWSPQGDGGYRPRVLPRTEGDAYPIAILPDGTVVGTSHHGGEPYVWETDGTGRALPLPDGLPLAKAVDARGDWAVGWAGETDQFWSGNPGQPGDHSWTSAVRWNVRSGETSTVGDDFTDGMSVGVNGAGDVVYLRGDPEEGGEGLVLVRGGRSYELPPYPMSLFASRVAISDDATVVVGTLSASAGPIGAVWHC